MRKDRIDLLAQKGMYFTVDDIKETLGLSHNSVNTVISRLEKAGYIERVEKGKYIIIPIGNKKGSYTLHEFSMASMLISPCIIAYWSALNAHGLTEQIPITVFIQSSSRKRVTEKEIFGIKYKIVTLKKEKIFGIEKKWIEDKQVSMTDREKTVIDCLAMPQYSGGIIEVAKAIKKGGLEPTKLASYCAQYGSHAVTARLGYLCELYGKDITLDFKRGRSYSKLDPTMPSDERKCSSSIIASILLKVPLSIAGLPPFGHCLIPLGLLVCH